MTLISATVRAKVRERTAGRCEYCGMPDSETVFPHHVDHITARKHGSSSDLNNLAWSCFLCNTAKGSDIATVDSQTGKLVRLFNPRSQTWNRLFRFDGPYIVGLTSVGRATVEMLELNHDDQIQARQVLMRKGLW